ncbi:MAG: hypothetical protein HOG08_02860, partial [Candidatus Magasanikbacteria bacterium]|nr:hypothetical protein [Candidatus Magasanikbacteria bacterium]
MHKKLLALLREKEPYIYLFGILLFFTFALSTIWYTEVKTITAPPSIITYQGKLLENNTVVTSTKAIQFSIYSTLTGGVPIYTASGTTVTPLTINRTPSSGIFSVDLGSTGTNSLDPTIFSENTNLYLEVVVAGTTLTPRKQLTAAPYALNSRYLQGVPGSVTSTSEYIPVSDSNGNITFAGDPQSNDVSGGTVYINPATADADETLFGIALGGSERFRIDEDGDVFMLGDLSVTGTVSFVTTTIENLTIDSTTINNNLTVGGTTTLSTTTIDQLTVNNNTTLNTTTINELLTVLGNTTLNTTTINEILTVLGDTTLSSTTISENLTVLGSTTLNTTTINEILTVLGETTLATTTIDNLTVNNDTILNSTTINDLFTVNATTTFTKPVIVSTTISSGDVIHIRNNGTSQFVINENGYVGINSSSPNYYLTVGGDGYIGGDLLVTGALTVSGTSTLATTTVVGTLTATTLVVDSINLNGDLRNTWPVAGGVSSSGLWASSTSNVIYPISGLYPVVIGKAVTSSATTIFEVDGNSLFEGAGEFEGNLTIDTDTLFVNADTNRVGVGTTTPGYTLTVDGTGYITGETTVANKLIISGKVNNPTLYSGITSATLLDMAYDIEVRDDYAYVIASSTFSVIDISDNTPSIVGSYTSSTLMAGEYSALAVSGDFVYITNKESVGDNLVILDISNPESPAYRSQLNAGLAISDITVVGTYAFITESFGGAPLSIVNIADIDNPYEMTVPSLDISNPGTIINEGNYLYLLDENGKLAVIHVPTIDSPSVVTSSIDLFSINGDKQKQGLFIDGNRLYATNGVSGEFAVVDVSTPGSPSLLGTVSTSTGAQLDGATGVFAAGDYAYVASDVDDALSIIDVSDPTSPTEVGFVTSTNLNGAHQVTVKGNYAYVVAPDADRMQVIDISGADIANAFIGNAEVSNLQVRQDTLFDGNISVRGGAQITGGGLLLAGDFSMFSNSTSTAATNTLRFSDITLLTSQVAAAAENTFILDSYNTRTAGNLLSVRNNGDEKFVVTYDGKVGINTSSPQYNLTVEGDTYISNTTTIMGRLGVGTTTPEYELSVNGQGYFTATTTMNSSLVVNGQGIFNDSISVSGKLANPVHKAVI